MDFLLGLLVGGIVSFLFWRSVIQKAIEQALLTPAAEMQPLAENQHDESAILKVTVEQEGDQFLLYRQDTNNFVMQGMCLQDFQQRLTFLKVDQISIVNGGSAAAKALLKISQLKKEHNENSSN